MTPPTALFPRTKSLRCARLEKTEDELVAKIVERRLRDEDPPMPGTTETSTLSEPSLGSDSFRLLRHKEFNKALKALSKSDPKAASAVAQAVSDLRQDPRPVGYEPIFEACGGAESY